MNSVIYSIQIAPLLNKQPLSGSPNTYRSRTGVINSDMLVLNNKIPFAGFKVTYNGEIESKLIPKIIANFTDNCINAIVSNEDYLPHDEAIKLIKNAVPGLEVETCNATVLSFDDYEGAASVNIDKKLNKINYVLIRNKLPEDLRSSAEVLSHELTHTLFEYTDNLSTSKVVIGATAEGINKDFYLVWNDIESKLFNKHKKLPNVEKWNKTLIKLLDKSFKKNKINTVREKQLAIEYVVRTAKQEKIAYVLGQRAFQKLQKVYPDVRSDALSDTKYTTLYFTRLINCLKHYDYNTQNESLIKNALNKIKVQRLLSHR